ncbi:hypothetical protein RB653_005270 [Dictyostelium firmibasis]|uniref:Uncharacterized protein n=1 Tax=Dictyostelium firmibasis TaxID=79012 RepID=A0AAN7Z0X1_9MYCE
MSEIIEKIKANEISVLIRPMHINDVNTIFTVQKETFPADDLFECYEAFENKFLVYPQGCFCVELILDGEIVDQENIHTYEPSSDLELNKKKLLGHFFSHPWAKGEFPPLNNAKAISDGVGKIIDKSTGELTSDVNPENIMLYLNEIAVRPMGRGFNLARLLTNRVLHHLSKQSPSFDHIGLVSVQGSHVVWSSIGFDIDHNIPQKKRDYLSKNYGEKSCYMKLDYSKKVKTLKNNQLYLCPNLRTNNVNSGLYHYGKLFKEVKRVSKL